MTESIGMRLRQAREKRQLSLPQVSETTKVRIHYLQALENDDLSAMPSSAQARGFLRIYADFLGVEVLDLLPSASAPAAAATEEPPTQPQPDVPRQLDEPPLKTGRPGLLEGVRSLIGRRAKRELSTTSASATLVDAQPQPAVAPQSPPEIPSAPKKKRLKR